MTAVAEPVWHPHRDEPLFVAELLYGADALADPVRERIVAYLAQVAETRTAPLHTCTAFNALHFGFDLQARGYRAAVLDPELFTLLTADTPRPMLPVGTFVRIDRGGRRSLWGEVVARHGADPSADDDGWVAAALSGAPPAGPGTGRTGQERTIVDVEAFGAPLTAAEHTELHRLRQRRTLLDGRGHLCGPVAYPASAPDGHDDVAAYQAHLLGPARPLLIGGPLGGLLTDAGDGEVLAAALQQALATIDDLLEQAAALRRWGHYAVSRTRYAQRRRTGWPGLPAADIDEVVRTLSRPTASPRYLGIWPMLAAHAARYPEAEDPLELAGGADVLVHANLAALDVAAAADHGLLPGGVHVRLDDRWQAGGVWLARRPPLPADVLATPVGTPLGLGYRDTLATAGDGTPPPLPVPAPAGTDAAAPEPGGSGAPVTDPGGHDEQDRPGQPAGDGNPTPDADSTVVPGPAEITDVVSVGDSLVVATVALRDTYWDDGILPLPEIAAVLAGNTLLLELHHPGDHLEPDERVQQVRLDGTTLHGIVWPLGFYPGIKVTVAVARGARRISASTTLLPEPLPFGEQYRWAADLRLLAAALGVQPPAGHDRDNPDLPSPAEPGPVDPPVRQRGVDQLRGLILAALRRHGTSGAFGARRLTGPQLLAALFGDDLVDPPLMWQVIYTCDRLVDTGHLTRESAAGTPDRPGSGGPDVFVWWPDTSTRRQGDAPQRIPTQKRRLVGHVREQWVPPFCRLLPAGYQASARARNAYADWIRKVRGPDADITLPQGYTFVRGGPRGSLEDGSWIERAAASR